MLLKSRLLLIPAALAVLCTAGSVRAGFTDWSYLWTTGQFGVQPNGGTKTGGVDFAAAAGGAGSPVAPVTLTTFTAETGGNDLYNNVGYSLTFNLTDNPSGVSRPVPVSGELTGAVTSSLAHLSNAFTNGSGSQGFDFEGHHYAITFGFTAADAAPLKWTGLITASVDVTDQASGGGGPVTLPHPPTNNTPEPTALVLAGLALPALGLAARRVRRR